MLVVVDLDGVIVDYGVSSREAAGRAAGAYLEEVCGVANASRLVQRRHTDAFKHAGGFVHDHDVTYAVLYTLLTSMPRMLRPLPPRTPPLRAREVLKAFRPKDIRLHALIGHSERSLDPTLIEINKRGGGIDGLKRFFADGVMEHYILHGGEIGVTEREAGLDGDARAEAAATREDLVRRLFEEFYYGDDRFRERHGVAPLAPRGEGLVEAEALLHPLEELGALADKASVTLLTMQPQLQVKQTLRRLGVERLFPHVVFEGDLDREEPRRHLLQETRPVGFNAWMFKQVVEAAAEVHAVTPSPQTLIFLSNTVHRAAVAARAGVRCVGVARQREERRPLKEAGCKAVISKLKTLLKAL
ncbi:MAG: hypothetical protein CMH57_09170 [Myxococcales bacterium]|nr:hypothetical protein [Myxococcales bacterium]